MKAIFMCSDCETFVEASGETSLSVLSSKKFDFETISKTGSKAPIGLEIMCARCGKSLKIDFNVDNKEDADVKTGAQEFMAFLLK